MTDQERPTMLKSCWTMKFDFDDNGRPEAIIIPEEAVPAKKKTKNRKAQSSTLDINVDSKSNGPLIALKIMSSYCSHRGRCYKMHVGHPFAKYIVEEDIWSNIDVHWSARRGAIEGYFAFESIWTDLWHQLEPIILSQIENVSIPSSSSSHYPSPRFPRFGNLIEISITHINESLFIYRYHDNDNPTTKKSVRRIVKSFRCCGPISDRIVGLVNVKPKLPNDQHCLFIISSRDMQQITNDDQYEILSSSATFEELDEQRESIFEQRMPPTNPQFRFVHIHKERIKPSKKSFKKRSTSSEVIFKSGNKYDTPRRYVNKEMMDKIQSLQGSEGYLVSDIFSKHGQYSTIVGYVMSDYSSRYIEIVMANSE